MKNNPKTLQKVIGFQQK